MVPDVNTTVAKLSGTAFTAAQIVDALQITPDILTNILTKVRPVLCTDSEGQGRARAFCLADVYIVAILDALTKLTGKAAWAAGSLARLAFVDIAYEKAGPLERSAMGRPLRRSLKEAKQDFQERRKRFGADVTVGHQMFWTREPEVSGTWVIFADLWSVQNLDLTFEVIEADRAVSLLRLSSRGFYLNVTHLLQGVDQRLSRLITQESAEDAR
jgi:hypothetical protein